MSWCSISTPPVYSTRWLCFVVASTTWLLLFSCSTRLLFCSFVCLTTVGKGMSVCVAFGVVFTRQGHFSQFSPTSVTDQVTEWLTDKARQWSDWRDFTMCIVYPVILRYFSQYLLFAGWKIESPIFFYSQGVGVLDCESHSQAGSTPYGQLFVSLLVCFFTLDYD